MIERKIRPQVLRLLFGLLAALLTAQTLRADEMMRQVQEELRKRHLYFGDIDGRFTPEVAGALRHYQERKGFPASGTPDEITLRSLTLVPPIAADHTISPLPDIIVLRSDAGRATDSIGEAAPSPNETDPEPPPVAPAKPPTPAPPPAASTARRPDAEMIRAFIERYLQAGQTNDPASEVRFYADQVDHFEDGVVDHRFLEEDASRYDHRWPERRFALAGPISITPAPGGDETKTAVRFRYRYAVKNSRYSLAGRADTEYVLAGNRPDDLRIVSMREQRVRP